ncbi:aminopeptidase N [Streptomyces acidiscabies]|uniref:Aminopeptidase N n=1 Tax=Streptomyces acidiscabies TaxID=42234 RepID=A0AAP6BE83_9ACTN|nr:aminopeptidase N [Streptomyces acidiscabies]MBP5939614.1 aminopeptidase N [Streptomyces sp. LBUM 1476]MBZ3910779.1 aminopeptidase N [Streptomyces acidiscabies]MDX2963038.1 aminopeptidase N [Streptomyces acidiscabies]MDX3017416.1 aminopeptidase N [Streptomyces acidiscabies]MDX3787892.1 aminopeptidase N [Streptomyces acidiscabies]
MPGENLSRDEARERAALLSVDAYEVSLDLRSAVGDPVGDRTFRSVTTLRFRCAEPGATSFADLIAPSVTAVSLNGRDLDPGEVFDGSRIALEDLAAENELIVDAQCAYSRTGEGMHRFVDPEDGEVYLYTQYEPADSRRVFANFEQPDLKAPFRFEVRAPEGWTVWSNGVGTQTDGVWRFAETKPISTYITCVVAGPYHYVTDSYARTLDDGTTLEIPLGAMCRKGLAPHFDADDVFLVTKQGLDFFHDHFDYPYPFGKYDQAFVPEYNLGAMENPGLVTFREEYIFRGKVTQASYEARANVILHEMAHMWFGDLVTMEWWDDLWLKESFADFMGAFSLVGATRFEGGWITFANRRKSWAYRADQLPSTHPVTADIRDLQDAKLNFDGITYAKGASVLKQLVAYVGQDAFLEGARRYFKRHAYGNTRLGDLLSVLEETSGRDMGTWAQSWLQTAGLNSLTPEVRVVDGRVAELAVLQEELPARPHRVAVGLYRRTPADGVVRYARAEVDVTGERTVVAELAGAEAPDLVLVNDDDLTYCKIRFDARSLETLRESLGDIADPLARALCWSALWNLTRDALLPALDFVELVGRFAQRESDIGVLQMLHAWAGSALVNYVPAAGRSDAEALVARVALRDLRAAQPGSEPQLAWARFFASGASSAEDLGLLRGLLDGTEKIAGLDVDQELRWTFLDALASHGAVGEGELAAELVRDDTASGKRHHVRCLASRPSAAVKAQAWAQVVEGDALSNALVGATIAGFARSSQRELTAPYVAKYFDSIERVWADRSIQIGVDVVSGLFPAYPLPGAEREVLGAADAWLASHEEAAPALRRLVLEGRDDLARALKAQGV